MLAARVILLLSMTSLLIGPGQADDIKTILDMLGSVLVKVTRLEKNFDIRESCKKGMLGHPPSQGYPHYLIYSEGEAFLCDTETDSGGWIIIQRRVDDRVDFYRGWEDYKNGFGNLNSNFWVGLDWIHKMTKEDIYELRVDLQYNGQPYYATYANFTVGSEAEQYKLSYGVFEGTAGESMKNNGMKFSTKDRDNDVDGTRNCGVTYKGAWWYQSCHYSNLNGIWGSTRFGEGMNWESVTGWEDSVTFSEMKIRLVKRKF